MKTHYLMINNNIKDIYRFKEISYSHQGSTNLLNDRKLKCYQSLPKHIEACTIKWDKLIE